MYLVHSSSLQQLLNITKYNLYILMCNKYILCYKYVYLVELLKNTFFQTIYKISIHMAIQVINCIDDVSLRHCLALL